MKLESESRSTRVENETRAQRGARLAKQAAKRDAERQQQQQQSDLCVVTEDEIEQRQEAGNMASAPDDETLRNIVNDAATALGKAHLLPCAVCGLLYDSLQVKTGRLCAQLLDVMHERLGVPHDAKLPQDIVDYYDAKSVHVDLAELMLHADVLRVAQLDERSHCNDCVCGRQHKKRRNGKPVEFVDNLQFRICTHCVGSLNTASQTKPPKVLILNLIFKKKMQIILFF